MPNLKEKIIKSIVKDFVDNREEPLIRETDLNILRIRFSENLSFRVYVPREALRYQGNSSIFKAYFRDENAEMREIVWLIGFNINEFDREDYGFGIISEIKNFKFLRG